MRYYLAHFGMSTIKKTTISNACKDVEKKEAFIHCCWEYKLVQVLQKTVWIFQRILWPTDAKNWHIGKDREAGKDWRQEKGMTEDEMVGWHPWPNGHESEQASGSWWWTGRHGVLQFMGSQSLTWLSHWTKLNWWRFLNEQKIELSCDLKSFFWVSIQN